MSSREIAELVEKRHDNVKRTIETLVERGVIQLPQIEDVKNHLGQTVQEYRIGKRDSYVIVAQLSPEFTARLVDRWQELENAQPKADPVALLNDPAALRGLLGNYAERVETLQSQIEADAPKVAFHDDFAEKDGLYTLQNAGRIITGRPNKFIQELKKQHLFYQGGALVPYVRYRQQGLFEVKIEPQGDYVRTQTYITPKGLQHFVKKFAGKSAPPGAAVVSALNDYLSGAH
ncbi:phage antirepressor KilAC domain-containing protein [Devosia sp. Naph2]|uniref:phage antirepressor KilAC domain-containing protein n=1 Tax=Devosia polycyclovorans TaxID=3345148 RepID=UPI0035CF3B8C